MLEEYSLEEKRELLRISRIRIGIETKVPREKATDSIVERGIFGCLLDRPCSEEDINNTISSLGLMKGLRKDELKSSLNRLCLEHRVEKVEGNKFILSKERAKALESEIQEANHRFDTIVERVYKPIIDSRNKKILYKFFLEFISNVFAQFGEQWIRSLCNQAETKDFLKEGDIENIFAKLAKKHGLDKSQRDNIKKLSIKFFEEYDPDYAYLKFCLGQSFYITKILGVDIPLDLFSKEVFANSIFYLDTNIIFASLLPVSKHNVTFKELLKICKQINIELNVSTITKNEVERVISYFEKEAVNIFDNIPENIIPKVRGTFFESYIEEKKKNPNFCVADLFEPFHNLKDTLKNIFSIEIIDSSDFDALLDRAEKNNKIQNIFNSKSLEIRKRSKGRESLVHDAFHYYLIEQLKQQNDKKAFFLTLDTSLPYAATVLQQGDSGQFCFTLDILMQCFSPFITADTDVHDFSEVFSKLITNQLFPSSKLFDIRDFIFFNDIGLEINQLSEEDVEEALTHIKKYVLKGRVYTHADFEKVSYEVKKLFSGRAEKDETIRKQLERISEMEKKHKLELEEKEAEIQRGKKEKDAILREARLVQQKRNWYLELTLFAITAGSSLFILICLTNFYAKGENLPQKIVSFWVYYTLWAVMFGFYFRWIKNRSKLRK